MRLIWCLHVVVIELSHGRVNALLRYCTVLFCTVQYCTVLPLYCIVLYCTVLSLYLSSKCTAASAALSCCILFSSLMYGWEVDSVPMK